MCRFSELTGCKFRREVTLDQVYSLWESIVKNLNPGLAVFVTGFPVY